MKPNRSLASLAGLVCQLALVASALAAPDASKPRFDFRDVAREAGIDFKKTFGSRELTNIVEDTGSGCAFFDYDGDGWLDLYFVNGCFLKGLSDTRGKGDPTQAGATGKLYRNLGDGRFEDVTVQAGLTRTFFGMGCAAGDYDGDGYTDLYVTSYGPNHLYRNLGDGTFADVSEAAGVSLAGWPKALGVNLSVGTSFLDYDRDGMLDLFVANYLVYDPNYHLFYPADAYPGPMAYQAQPDSLFHNEANGRFADVSRSSGVQATPPGRSMGLGTADVDGDGWIDVYVANDRLASFLYMNQRNGTFKEAGRAMGCASGLGGEGVSAMAVEFGDLDAQGVLDLYVTASGYGAIYRNEIAARGRFRDVTTLSGTAAASGQYIGWGGGMVDMDNDGNLDLVRVNGDFNHLQPQEDLIFAGLGGYRFEDVSSSAGPYFQLKLQGRGAAFGDYDRDGLVDFAVVTLTAPSCLVRNGGAPGNNWLGLELVGIWPRDPVGLELTATVDGRKRLLQVRGASGYLSQFERTVRLGLGAAKKVDRLEIRWSRSPVQVVENLPANRIVRIVEPAPRR